MFNIWQRGEMYTGFWGWGPEGKGPLGRTRFRGENNIKMYVQKVR